MCILPKVTILFGSQTGNAEDVAERIGREVIRLNCKAHVFNIMAFPPANLIKENFVVFVCSTTGNGEVPDNMKSFWRFLLRKDLPRNSLSYLNFCVFGLGDSSYDKFNVVAKRLNKRILQLGGSEIVPLGLGDDQHELGYDAAYDTWISNLINKLISFYELKGPFLSDDILIPARYKVEFDITEPEPVVNKNSDNEATLKENIRITSTDHFQAVHLLKFEISSDVKYDPGDVAVVKPENSKDNVEEFLSLLNVPFDAKFILNSSDLEVPIPKIFQHPFTVRECVASYFDIMSVPKRSFFEFFHHFSKDELEKEKLKEFTTALGQEELFTYCNRPKRSILEIMKDFPNTTPYVPFDYLFDMIPQIHPRKFSIASALSFYPKQFHLAVAVVEYKTRLAKLRKGLCSNWLVNLKIGDKIPFAIQKGSIKLPSDESPIIMVGPGTGCAPFRSFLQEREQLNIKENILFFGCRFKMKDYLFSSEWEKLVNKGFLVIFTAFSRDQEEKCYVQHKIKENGKILFDWIHNKKAHIYIAGNAKQMPDGVKNAIAYAIEKEGGFDNGHGITYIEKLINNKRFHQETWA